MTYTERIVQFFRTHEGEWVDGQHLSRIGGIYAWRSRVSDARKKYHLTIDNRLRKEVTRTVSEYRYRERPRTLAELFSEDES